MYVTTHDDITYDDKPQVFCGTNSHPELGKAEKYKIHEKLINKTDFQYIMQNLHVDVSKN